MTSKESQLDLTQTLKEVPQANSLPLFITLLEDVARDGGEVAELAKKRSIDERTVHYYLDFARWLELAIVRDKGVYHLNELGKTFVDSVPARGRLFAQALFGKELIQAINTLKRESRDEDDLDQLTTLEASRLAIERLTELSDSTAERRASAVAHMLEAAYRPSRIDWNTGEELEAFQQVQFDFAGRTFLTAMAARQFTSSREYRIGFPCQVSVFSGSEGHGLSHLFWNRASWDGMDGRSTYFGPVPVDNVTSDIAARGGRDLRKLVTMTAPYITLAVALLTWRDHRGRPAIRLTHDMYGLQFWRDNDQLGSPLEVIERLAQGLDLFPVKGVPKALTHAPAALVESGNDADLVETLLTCAMVKREDTTFELARGFEAELREGSEASPSLLDRLRIIHQAVTAMIRHDAARRA